jgi:membrane protease YdiL (CAAX protease family)
VVSLFVDAASGKLRSAWVIAIFAVLAAGTFGGTSAIVALLQLYPRTPLSLEDGYLVFSSMTMLAAAGVPTIICALAFKAEVGLPRPRAPRDLALGVALGAALISLTVWIPVLLGHGTTRLFAGSVGATLLSGLQQLFTLGPTAVGEELLLRGVVLRQLAAGTRPWLAVLLTGGCFGLMHLNNPDSSWIAAVNVALVGLWFGVLALRTTLWTALAAHVAWNWFEGFVYGQPVSGILSGHSLFVGSTHGRGFFDGGAFGPEASGLTTVLLVLATLAAALWPPRSRA